MCQVKQEWVFTMKKNQIAESNTEARYGSAHLPSQCNRKQRQEDCKCELENAADLVTPGSTYLSQKVESDARPYLKIRN